MVLSEILFNPPGEDAPQEYLELRGPPNLILPPGTALVTVEGNAGANPGVIRNVFDLSGQPMGGNGHLLLLQQGSPYTGASASTVLRNAGNGTGWGSGSSSSIGHRGLNDVTDLENASVTFCLLKSAVLPVPGIDVDENNDGRLDGPEFASWTILDSVGVLDADGAGDYVYGAVNFRRNTSPGNGAGATGTVIPISFTPRYVGRVTGKDGLENWAASDELAGAAPNWLLAPTPKTFPASLANAALDHLGTENFGAAPLPGVVLRGAKLDLLEGGPPGELALGLNTLPSGTVTVRVSGDEVLRLRHPGTANYTHSLTLTFLGTNTLTLEVRAEEDFKLGPSPTPRLLTLEITATEDVEQYSTQSLLPKVQARVFDSAWGILNELKVNPPGTNDGPFEFVELLGSPGMALENVFLVALSGVADPGLVRFVADLSGAHFGTRGVLLVRSPDGPYTCGSGSECLDDPQLSAQPGALPNEPFTLLLLATTNRPTVGSDWDSKNSGSLRGLPAEARLLDSVAFSGSGSGERLYSPAVLRRPGVLPDAAVRYPSEVGAHTAGAWLADDLAGSDGTSLELRGGAGEGLFYSSGTWLTPGSLNRTAPEFKPVQPLSGVVGYPRNPRLVLEPKTGSDSQAWAQSANPLVLADSDIAVERMPDGRFLLSFSPRGVGFAEVTVFLTSNGETGRVQFPYAASQEWRRGGIWLLDASDGSAGVPAGDGHYWVADDEQTSIRLYDLEGAGIPIRTFHGAPYLELPDQEAGWPREVDLEGATRAGEILVWIGSHGHAAIGEPRTNRTRVFATQQLGSGPDSRLEYLGRYDHLKADLIAWDEANGHGRGTNYYGLAASDADGVPPKAPDGSGFAIEGLAMIPGLTNAAFIGFRAPIVPAAVRTHALLVPVLNLVELVTSERGPGSSRFGAPVELDLYGRGIRSVEADSEGFLIIAGPAGGNVAPYPGDFQAYRWSGRPDEPPGMLSADWQDLNPEGILALPGRPWNSESKALVLSDLGTWVYYGAETPAKALPYPLWKKCRADWVSLGPERPVPPVLSSVEVVGGALRLTWRALAGSWYAVQSSSSLATQDWTVAVPRVWAGGPFPTAEVPLGSGPGFFRVVGVEGP